MSFERARWCRTSIDSLPPGIDALRKLQFLDLQDCTRLRQLPHDFGCLTSLKGFGLSRCDQSPYFSYVACQ